MESFLVIFINIKKFKIFFFSIIFFCYSLISAQNPRTQIDSLTSLPYDLIYSEPKKFISKFQKWIEIADEINYKYGKAKLLSKLALMYSSVSNLDKAQETRIKAIKLFEELGKERDLINEYGLYGYSLLRSNLQLAKDYMLLAMELAEKNDDKQDLCTIYGHYSTALEFEGNLDSALYYSKKGLEIKYEIGDTLGIPYSLNDLAGIYAQLGNMDKAFEYMAESDKFRQKEKNDYGRAENAVILGELYVQVNKYDEAIKKFNESLKLAKKMGNKHMAQYNYKKLSDIYQKMGNYEAAYKNLKEHKIYQDSILNNETKSKIAELEVKFESEKKDKEIIESKLKLKERNTQIIFIAGISLALLLMSFGLYRFQKYKQKQITSELKLKNKLAKMELKNKISDEKLRISRELHDNIGSQITFLVSSLDNLTYLRTVDKNLNGKNVTYKLEKLSSFGRTILTDLRNTIWAMKNDDTTIKNIIAKLNELKFILSENLGNIKIHITNNVSDDLLLTSTQNLNLYRIVQEFIQNSIKHSNATKIEVSFNETENGFSMQIKDNGNGFDVSVNKEGNGLRNMEQRCNEASGKFNIKSSSEGTIITCEITTDRRKNKDIK